MRRLSIGLAVAAALACSIGRAFPREPDTSTRPGAAHSREGIPPTPPELRKFEGALYGTVERIRGDRSFTGLLLRVALAQPAGTEPVDLQKIAGAIVPIAIPTNRDGKPQPADLARSFRALSVHEAIWADVKAAGSNHLLYARNLGPTGPAPAASAPAAAAPDSSASPEHLRRMEAELRALRRDLAHLQQDAADLRLRTEELQRRAPARR